MILLTFLGLVWTLWRYSTPAAGGAGSQAPGRTGNRLVHWSVLAILVGRFLYCSTGDVNDSKSNQMVPFRCFPAGPRIAITA